jgi:hypothetical protein
MAHQTCQNCGSKLQGKFCSDCGQKDVDLRRPFFVLIHDFLESSFHLDHRVWRSLALVLWAPGLLARRYLSGQRVRYVSPTQFYLLSTLMFFLVLSASNMALLSLAPDERGAGFGLLVAETPSGDSALPNSTVVRSNYALRAFVHIDSLPPASAQTAPMPGNLQTSDPVAREFIADLAALSASPKAMNSLIKTWSPRLLIVLVPILALILALAVRSGAPFFTHVMFSVYFHSTLFVLLTVIVASAAGLHRFGINIPAANIFAGLFVTVLGIGIYHAYQAVWWRTLLRVAFVVGAYVFCAFLSLNALIIISYV